MDITRALGISWDVFNRERKNNSDISEAYKKGVSLGLAKVTSSLFENATKRIILGADLLFKEQIAR